MIRFILTVILLSLNFGCTGVKVLESKLKDAQRERDILRDAYEAQQLRLKELESRLLKLEDGGLAGNSTVSAAVNAPTRYASRQRTKVKTSRQSAWSRERLRALPVVMVKRDQIASKLSKDAIERNTQEDELERTQVKSQRQKERSSKKRTRKRSSRKVNISPKESLRASKDANRLPTLTANNVRQYRDPDRALKQEQDVSQLSQEPKTSMSTSHDEKEHEAQTLIESEKYEGREKYEEREIPNSMSQNLRLAQSYRKQGRLQEAMRMAKRLISEAPTDPLIPDVLYLMGRLQIEQGQNMAGRSTLLRLSRLYPQTSAAKEAQVFLNLEGS